MKFGVAAIHIEQSFRGMIGKLDAANQDAANQGVAALACPGFGSLVSVTAATGFAAA